MEKLVTSKDFPSADGFIYLNAANISLVYQGATDALVDWYKDTSLHGSNNFDEVAEVNTFEDLRQGTAQMLNANPEDIAVGSSATELLSSLAWAVLAGAETNVVSTKIVFPSTVYPWRRVGSHSGCEIRLAESAGDFVNEDDIIDLIDQNTAVVSISHVEYSNGQCFDLDKLSAAAHEKGALLVVDATQSMGAIPIDVAETAVDALVSGSYKWLCAPMGAAVMYLAPELQSDLEPGLVGFRSHNNMWDLEAGRLDYPDTAKKFEFSTMAYGCAIALARSMEFINSIGVDRVFAHNRDLADHLSEGLRSQGATIISDPDKGYQSSIVSAALSGMDSSKAIKQLKEAGVYVSSRADSIRFSPHLYNYRGDIDNVLDHMKRIFGKNN